MSTLGRRGFTLIELMVAVVLLGIVTAGIYRALLTNQRTYQAQTQRIDLQQNIRAAVAILPAEFRELNASDGDILAMSADSIRIRALRQFAVICSAPLLAAPPGLTGQVTLATFIIRDDPAVYSAARPFQVGDGVLVYYEGDAATRSDDSWVVGQVTVVAGQNCPDLRPGWAMTASLSFSATQFNRTGVIPHGAPVRGWEPVTYLRYQAADGRHYIGMRTPGGLQPLIGPVTANGLSLLYFDAAGAVTAVSTQVATIEVRLRAETAQPVTAPGGGGAVIPVDSVVTRVTLRNNRLFGP